MEAGKGEALRVSFLGPPRGSPHTRWLPQWRHSELCRPEPDLEVSAGRAPSWPLPAGVALALPLFLCPGLAVSPAPVSVLSLLGSLSLCAGPTWCLCPFGCYSKRPGPGPWLDGRRRSHVLETDGQDPGPQVQCLVGPVPHGGCRPVSVSPHGRRDRKDGRGKLTPSNPSMKASSEPQGEPSGLVPSPRVPPLHVVPWGLQVPAREFWRDT